MLTDGPAFAVPVPAVVSASAGDANMVAVMRAAAGTDSFMKGSRRRGVGECPVAPSRSRECPGVRKKVRVVSLFDGHVRPAYTPV
ncbi:hypothetical protein GCM10009560_44290 [Nonomuraea longicatena]|uniref:Uncharacterized protein n=1 Tax=Nonomuraea longicatena TaxID=83682 RepID=A0ABP4AG13_9ACTN